MSIQQRPYPFSGSAPDNKYSTAVDSSLSLHTSKSHLHSYLKRGLRGQATNKKDLNVSMGDEEGLVHHHHRVSSSLTTTTTTTSTSTTTPTTTPSPSLPSLSSSSSTPSMSLTSVTSEDGPDASGNGCGNGLFEENEKGLIDHQYQDQKHCVKVGNENDNDSDNDKDKVSTSTSTTTITQLGLRLDQMQLQDNTTITRADSDGDGVVREQEQEYEAGPSTAFTSIGLLPLQLSSSPLSSTTSSASSSTSSLPTISNSPPIITTTTTTTITITSASTPNLHESVSSANVIALSVSSDNDSGSGNTNGNENGDRNASTSLRSLLRPRQVSDFTGQQRLQEQQNSLNVKFAPLPELEPRKRKSNTPLGMAAKRQIARRRADPGMFDQEGVYWSQEEFDRMRAVQEQRVLQQEHPDLTPEELAMKEERIRKKEERRREKDREREERRLKKDEERQAKEMQTDPFVAAVKKMSVISRTMWKKMSNKDLKGLSEEEMREEEEWKKKRKEYKRKQRERHANQKASLVARYEIPEKPADEEQGEGRVWIEEVGEPYRKMQELRAKESIDTEPIILNSEPSSPNVVE